MEQHASSLCKKIFRKNGCSIDGFETEWKNGLTSNGTQDCAVLAIEEIKLLARKKEIEEKEYTHHEMKNFRLQHIGYRKYQQRIVKEAARRPSATVYKHYSRASSSALIATERAFTRMVPGL